MMYHRSRTDLIRHRYISRSSYPAPRTPPPPPPPMPASERRLPPAKQGSKILLTETLRKKESTKLRE